jgi:Domain of unknown function (DUF1707)/2TM domain
MPDPNLTHPTSAGGLRVGDAERELVASQLADHHAAGRLSLDELDERLTATWSARTRAELAATLVDLPTPASAQPTASARRPLSPAVVGWRLHLVSYLTVIAGLWLIWALTGSGYPWPIWPMLGWGLGLLGQRAQLSVSGQLKMPARG